MITIPVTVTGDHWLNPQQVSTALELTDPKETLILDICSEGPSLYRLGVIDAVLTHCERQSRDPGSVYISRWSNPVETVPFNITGRSDISHFYWASDRYWPQHVITCQQGRSWGFFMGRPTIPRLLLLRHLVEGRDAVLSSMQGGKLSDPVQGINLDREEFGPRPDLETWWQGSGIGSLDGACIRDQYKLDKNTNLSLLKFYDQFHVEIVSESYVYGETFFPTEKTVRPLSAGKPIIVMGPRHFLRRLQQQGFKTWSDFWDESYDDLEGPARVAAIQQLITDLAPRLNKILPAIIPYAKHNRDTLAALIQKHRPGT